MGFDKDHVLIGQLDVSRTQVDPAARMDFYRRIIEAASAVPGVRQAAVSTSTPLNMGLPGEVNVPGAPSGTASERVVLTNRVTPGWFAAYGTAIRDGRDFDARETAINAPAVILNDAFAHKFFSGRNPLGETVAGRTVVGVVEDQVVSGGFKWDGSTRSRRDAAPPIMYIPLAQAAGVSERGDLTLSVRSAGDPSHPMGGLAAALTSVHPDLTFSFRTLAESLNASIAQDRLVALLSGFFGGLAVLLAALGLYGVTSYAVSRQRAEIGIRLALGATPGRVVRMVMSRVTLLIAAGIATGLGLSVWASAVVTSLLYGLTPRDPITVGGAVVTLVLVGAIAGAVPAYRASRIDPARTLRSN
jgi:predicted permease